jgi:hypothetical protein
MDFSLKIELLHAGRPGSWDAIRLFYVKGLQDFQLPGF